MIILLILLLLLFGGGFGYRSYGYNGGFGIVGALLVILLIVYLFGGFHAGRFGL